MISVSENFLVKSKWFYSLYIVRNALVLLLNHSRIKPIVSSHGIPLLGATNTGARQLHRTNRARNWPYGDDVT